MASSYRSELPERAGGGRSDCFRNDSMPQKMRKNVEKATEISPYSE
jgi:hypothetical protein